ncbi:MAG: hypothetical protein ABIK13_04055 [Patescibacteria group bacterium]|nr:hypothetical protein [Patescibacteria group bacterium]
MTFRLYMALMSAATLMAIGAWTFVVWSTNPQEAPVIGFVMFYMTLFLSLVGLLTLGGVGYRVLILGRRDLVSREVRVSFRHAIFLASIAVVALAGSAAGWLRWWMFLLLLIVVSVVEYVFLVKEEARRS